MIRRLFASAGTAAFLTVVIASPTAAHQATPTFNKDIAPIFYAHCAGDPPQGEIAPMSLLTYKEARPWARSIATKVKSGAMPPWHADPAIGHFINERRLTEEQKNLIAKWADTGALEGDAKDL